MSNLQISRATMFGPVLAADASFRPMWDKLMAEWSDEPEPPLYIALGMLAEHLLEKLSRGDTEAFERIFAVVEQWLVSGDAYVSEAATIGLLESLQNRLGWKTKASGPTREGLSVADLEIWFGPETKRWWDKLHRFWEGDSRALRTDT